tara:strand:- start:1065 stop:1256 length:192 start_codon:yes stop_codon:yes gene_type:complete
MSDKKFFELIIGLLKSIDDNTKLYKDDDEVYIENDDPISMSREVYNEICDELEENDITFMGIT